MTSSRQACRVEWLEAGEVRAEVVDRRSSFGSAPRCDVIVSDPAVSAEHVEIEPSREGVWIHDLGSRNGTYVGAERIESQFVSYGARIRIGSTDLVLSAATIEQDHPSVWPTDSLGPLIGTSLLMRELFMTLSRIAPLDFTVMIRGETGTGKELVAQAIHERSGRAAGPFTVVDCGAISPNLFEAELFGHAKGAFTGADRVRIGAIEGADKGTVFLDEIGELPVSMQPKLLRVLESSTVRRLGESQHREVDVRFVAATHRDLRAMVEGGEFREDLYFRLAVVPVRVPPLRERPEDIPGLLARFLGGTPAWLVPDVLRRLESRPWRGNVRELRNFANRVQATSDFRTVLQTIAETNEETTPKSASRRERRTSMPASTPSTLPVEIPREAPTAKLLFPALAPSMAPAPAPSFNQPLRDFREAWMMYGERAYLRALRDRHTDNVVAAAKEAGIDRTHLYRLLRKYSM